MAKGKKKRVKVPRAVEAQVLFANDHTCCMCHDSSRDVLLHHINGDPSDNRPENLAVVCSECNTRIHRRSPVSKSYSAGEVRQYKRLWEDSVARKREFLGVPKIRETITEIDLSSGVERRTEREVPYLDGLALKALDVVPRVQLSEGEDRALEEARRIVRASGSAERLLFIAARLKRDEAAHASREMILSRVCLAIGDAKFHESDYASAESHYQEALEYAESTNEAAILEICLSELAAAVGMQGRHEQALGYLDRLVALNPDDPAAWYNRGICLLALKMPKEALGASTRAIELGRRAEAWSLVASGCLNAGVAHQETGNPKKALESYEDAIETGSKAKQWTIAARACYNAATASETLRRHEDAIAYCLKAIDIGSKAEDWSIAADAYGQMGQAQVALGRYLEGIESYEGAIEIAVGEAEWRTVAAAYLGVAVAQFEQTQYEDSIESCLQAVESGTKAEAWRVVARGHYNMGRAQAKPGSDEEAVKSFENAIEVGRRARDWQTVARAYNMMAAVQGGLGLLSGAVESCQKAIRIGGRVDDKATVAKAHLSLGKALAGLGRHAKAINSYQEALQLRAFVPDIGGWVFTSIVESNCFLGTEATREGDLPRAREYAFAVAEVYLDADESEMGELVLEALAAFGDGVPHGHHQAFKRFRQLVMDCLKDSTE